MFVLILVIASLLHRTAASYRMPEDKCINQMETSVSRLHGVLRGFDMMMAVHVYSALENWNDGTRVMPIGQL